MQTKYVFVTGGVVSGLGKGITAASLGRLLKARGYSVTLQKFDPYINIDPGTMSPYQHGEVFVTEDGAEADLDLGHYERFVDENLSLDASVTTGRIYASIIQREREGYFGGETVQVIPHVTDAIKARVYSMAHSSKADFVISEIGGTVGDIESTPFLEALRQVAQEVGRENVLYIHVTLLPTLEEGGALNIKPSQQSVKTLLGLGIQPGILVCRTETPLTPALRDKLALSCNVERSCVIENTTAPSLYAVPLMLERENFAQVVLEKLGLPDRPAQLDGWRAMVARQAALSRSVRIALVGKYVELHDAYLSVVESLYHAGIEQNVQVDIQWVSAQDLEDKGAQAMLGNVSAVIVPGGFGTRGTEGMIQAIEYARTHKIPYFGICLGMQLCIVEYARHVLGLADAHSSELMPETTDPVIDLLADQRGTRDLGSTLRRGSLPVKLLHGSLAQALYGSAEIHERHRHRYGVNTAYSDRLTQAGLQISGLSPDGVVIEMVELPADTHPWYIGVQCHPEFKSRPNRPHPLFRGFVRAALAHAGMELESL